MKRWVMLVWMLGWAAGTACGGTPAQAAAIRTEHEQAVQDWVAKLRAAKTLDDQRKIWGERPNGLAAAKRMWACLAGTLDQEWTLEPAAWLFRAAAVLQGPVTEGDPKGTTWQSVAVEIRSAVERRHLNSARLAPMCLALVALPDPKSLEMLEKVERGNPDRKVQGVAALGISMLLKTLGDEGDVMKRRLAMLRKAIIESADVEIDGQTVAKLAEDELYIIRYLSKGRTAPDLTGKGTGGRTMKLSDHDDKVVVLVFWGTWAPEAEHTMELLRALNEKMAAKPFALVGVNNDPEDVLRKLEMSHDVTWQNFSDPKNDMARIYRVSSWPAALVLDRKRVIQYIGVPGSFVDFTVEALLENKPAPTGAPAGKPATAAPPPGKALPSGPPPENR